MSIPMNSKGAVDKSSVISVNNRKTLPVISTQNIHILNKVTWSEVSPVSSNAQGQNAGNSSNSLNQNLSSSQSGTIPTSQVQSTVSKKQIPVLKNSVQKGQKINLETNSLTLDVLFGWNVKNADCDVDVSAFLLGENGKVPGDDWFVFYGQPESPDKSIVLSTDEIVDRQKVSINFQKLNPNVKKIVFVLTINEAFDKKLNFSMIEDVYIRVLDSSKNELVSFVMSEYYDSVISMMIGEIYLYKDNWKFSSVGNGVARDLAGLCELYGVQVD